MISSLEARAIMRKLLLSLGLVFCLTGCNEDVKSIKITDENKTNLLDTISDKKGLTIGESRLLIGYILRVNMASAFSDKDASLPVGKTIANLIEDQEKFSVDLSIQEEKEKKLAEETKKKENQQDKEEQARIAKLNDNLTFSLYGKGFYHDEDSYEDYVTLDVVYKNNAKKTIRGFKGKIHIKDIFNEPIKIINLTVDTPIESGKTLKETRTMKYNQFIDSDKQLKNTEFENIKYNWVPISILYK